MILFTVPKPFRGRFAQIQKNAIESWLKIQPKPTIVLCGSEYGVEDVAKKYGCIHMALIGVDPNGVPLLNTVFDGVQKQYRDDIYLYVNSDIIFLDWPTAMVATLRKRFPAFLAIGKRYETESADRSLQTMRLKGPSWMDYFLFTRGVFLTLPPFLLGRTFWDKWLVWDTLQKKIPVIDVTSELCAIHQSHPYSFTPKTSTQNVWAGEGALRNIMLAGGWSHSADIGNATYKLTRGDLVKQKSTYTPLSLRKIMDTMPILWPLFLQFRLLYQRLSSVMQQK